MGVSIIGSGRYVPDFVLANDKLEKLVDTTDEWIVSRTGISERRIAIDEMTWQLGAKAAAKAIENAGIDPMTIDRVVCTAVTTDYLTPSCACMIANAVGAHNAMGMDINTACAGFVYALDIAERYLRDDDCETVLVVSAEEMSKMVDYDDRATCVLFGDGAGACIVKKSDKLFKSFLGGDPTGSSSLFARGIPPSNPFMKAPYDMHTMDGLSESKGHGLYQNGKAVYKFATQAMPSAIEKACERAKISISDLALIIPHQANIRIIDTAAKNLGLPIEKFFVNIKKYGNMSSACIPVALSEAIEQKLVKSGDKICLVGFGAGLVYGAAVFEI